MLTKANFIKLNRNILSIHKRSLCDISESCKNNPYEEDFRKHNIPISLFQRTLLSLGSASMSLLDPYRADMIACLGETTGSHAAKYMSSKMESSEEGSQILRNKPRINSRTVDLHALRKLPEGTLGKVYVDFLDKNNITPDSREPVRFIDDIELAYIIQRYREIHDLVHALLGMNINMLGEVTVKWVEAIQTKLPMCIGGALFGPIRLRPKQRRDYLNYYLPWAIETGNNSEFFMNVYFENRWEQPIQELLQELNVKPLNIDRNEAFIHIV
ncbi:hypothetical protein WA026_016905 [Henosepilachna vigintioctopunctata]|uniref:Ubiquinone biosynthesis protein COQ4 homolog, mitochondrial n=1 Tax=Henosepilachna vigintioctopunctata TaxID=420089 RepID=A0AAW1U3L9_9CUCU